MGKTGEEEGRWVTYLDPLSLSHVTCLHFPRPYQSCMYDDVTPGFGQR